jgi:hypothetical protein
MLARDCDSAANEAGSGTCIGSTANVLRDICVLPAALKKSSRGAACGTAEAARPVSSAGFFAAQDAPLPHRREEPAVSPARQRRCC